MQDKQSYETFHQEAFLKKVLKILKQLNSVNEKNVKRAYKMVHNDIGYDLLEKPRLAFFTLMKSISKVLKVLTIEGSHCSFSGLALDGSSYFITFQKESLDTKIVTPKEYENAKRCFIYLKEAQFDSESQILLSLQKSFQNSKEETKTNGSLRAQTLSSQQMDSSLRKHVHDDDDDDDEQYDSHGTPWNGINVVKSTYITQNIQPLDKKGKEDYSKGIGTSLKKVSNGQLEAYQNVLQKLADMHLHSSRATKDYGIIPYAEFFEKLIKDPNHPTNRRWIKMFSEPISNEWSHYCLVAIRDYIRTYPPC